jgi:hypothetical protein
MSLTVFEHLNAQADDNNGRVAIGTCNCNPSAIAFATLDDIEKDFKVVCGSKSAHPFNKIRLDATLSELKIRTKKGLRALLSSWITFRENLPGEQSFDVAGHEVEAKEVQPEDAGDDAGSYPTQAPTTLDATTGAVVLANRNVVLGADFLKPEVANSPVQQVHGKLHLLRDFLLQYGFSIMFDVAGFASAMQSGDLHRVISMVDFAVQKYLPGMMHGFTNELAMQVFSNRLADQRMVRAIEQGVQRFHNDRPASNLLRAPIHVAAATNETQEQAERAEAMRRLRSFTKGS